MVSVDPLVQLVAEGFAVIVDGNDETLRIFGISLLRALNMPLYVELFKVNGNVVAHLQLQGSFIGICIYHT